MLSKFGIISDEEIIRSFGKRLKSARQKKGMTQEELGGALGIDKSRISDYENGNRRCGIATAYRLAKAADVSFDYLFDGKEIENMRMYQNCTDREKLISVLTSLGFAIVDRGFISYCDENFADYSTMYSLGLTEEALGKILQRFETIKQAAGKNGSIGYEKLIMTAAEECADSLFASETFKDRIGDK